MRYENWDVLLFPEGSKVPVQEFKTQCFSTRDLDSPYLHNQVLDHPASHYHQAGQGGPGQIPVLTAFVPSLARGNPFRISVHSWERPCPTRILESLMQSEDTVMYEVRIFIDGYCISGSLFNNNAPWPHVIDVTSQMDKNGNQDPLRFPPFHEEILQHARWDATEVYGRIRVVVAEGFARPHRNPPFERVRDLIVFSFQHAPLPILEQSNIAWPNPGMWQQGPRPFVKYAVGLQPGMKDDEAHSHSPIRHNGHGPGNHDGLAGQNFPMWPYRLYPNPPMPWQPAPWPERDHRWGPAPPAVDPFVEPFRAPMAIPMPTRRNRSTLTDVSMPDYYTSTSNSSRVISSTTGSSLARNKEPSAPASLDDEQYNQLIEALSPKKQESGTCAPTNTPASSNQPTKCKPAAKKSRPTPSPGNKACRSPLKELSQPSTRATSRVPSHQPSRVPSYQPSRLPSRGTSRGTSRGPSGASSKVPSRVPSNASLDSQDENHPLLPVDLLTPDARVVGRKERRRSCGGISPGGGQSASPRRVSSGIKTSKKTDYLTVPGSSETKRKRRESSMDSTPLKNTEKAGPSPTKKMSRYLDQEERPPETLDALLDETSMIASGGCVLDEAE